MTPYEEYEEYSKRTFRVGIIGILLFTIVIGIAWFTLKH